jgi:hypothetical protein
MSTADQLAERAREVLGWAEETTAGLWQRAAALLARQALEAAVGSALASRAPGTELCSARAQLLCLPSYVSTEAGLEAGYLWSVLSRACHQHAYELDPTCGRSSPCGSSESRASSQLSSIRPKSPSVPVEPRGEFFLTVPPDLESFVATARGILGPAKPLAKAEPAVPDSPGLYAIHGDAGVWRELGLGDPPTGCPASLPWQGRGQFDLARPKDTLWGRSHGPVDCAALVGCAPPRRTRSARHAA